MSLSNTNTEQITLTGHSPSVEILKFIEKIDRNLLLPCPRTADDLQMPDKNTIPREMNSFIVFRRQLAHVAKQLKTSDDGRVISKAASVIWRGASKSEKQSYTQIAEELKKRHREKYPNYTYERRKRKTAGDDFIVIDAGTIIQDRKKKRPRKSPPKSSAVHVSEEQECAPIPTIMQDQGNGAWLQFNPLTSQVDNFIYSNNIDDDCFPCPEYQSFRDEQIPQLYQTLTSF